MLKRLLIAGLCVGFLVAGLASGGKAAPAPPLPEAGGLTALPTETTEKVPLANPGFEEQGSGWGVGAAGAFAVTEGEAHSGKACLRLDCAEKTQFTPSARQALKDAGPGIYRLSFWVKAQGVGEPVSPRVGGAGGPTGGGRVSLEFTLQGGGRSWPSTTVFNGTSGWQRVELSALVPPNMTPGSLQISIHRYASPGSGQALFDDVALERLLPPPVEAFLLYPNYRGYLPADGPQRVRAWVRVNGPPNPPNSGGAKAILSVRDATGRVVETREVPAAPDGQVVELDSSAWKPGAYEVQARLGEYAYPAYRVQKITAEQCAALPVWFDANQVAYFDGKPTFPIGLYNTLAKFGEMSDGELDRLKKMAEAPVNLSINYWAWGLGTEARRRYLEGMRQHGMWYLETANHIFPPFGTGGFPIMGELVPEAKESLATQELVDTYQTRLAKLMRDLPAFAGWYVMDERPFDRVPAVFHEAGVLRAADPGHPVYGVSNLPAEFPRWRDTLDVFGMDPYPLFNMKAGQPLSLVANWTRATVEATQGSRPVWMVLQFFQGWSADRWPTQEELRAMSLMAITEGARGVLYWSYGNRALASVGEAAREEYWQRLVPVAKELKSLEPALTAPDAPDAVKSVSDARVRWRARVAGGKTYVFSYIPSEKFVTDPAGAPPVEVRFELAGGRTVTRTLRPDSADWFASP